MEYADAFHLRPIKSSISGGRFDGNPSEGYKCLVVIQVVYHAEQNSELQELDLKR